MTASQYTLADIDVQMQIEDTFAQLNIVVTLAHVKGHQDGEGKGKGKGKETQKSMTLATGKEAKDERDKLKKKKKWDWQTKLNIIAD
eukprot:480869-Ditylum_brightwellii.AAC.1